jgi:hypothetical protein
MDPQEIALQTEALLETWLDAINAAIVGPTPDPRAQPMKAQLLQLMIRLDSLQRQGPGLHLQQAQGLAQVLPLLTARLTPEQRAAFGERLQRSREEDRFAARTLPSASGVPGARDYPVQAGSPGRRDAIREYEEAAERARRAAQVAEAQAHEAVRAEELARAARTEADALARAAEAARQRAEAAEAEELLGLEVTEELAEAEAIAEERLELGAAAIEETSESPEPRPREVELEPPTRPAPATQRARRSQGASRRR